MKKTLLYSLVAVFLLTTMNACSTVEGVGKDLQQASQAVQRKVATSNSEY